METSKEKVITCDKFISSRRFLKNVVCRFDSVLSEFAMQADCGGSTRDLSDLKMTHFNQYLQLNILDCVGSNNVSWMTSVNRPAIYYLFINCLICS